MQIADQTSKKSWKGKLTHRIKWKNSAKLKTHEKTRTVHDYVTQNTERIEEEVKQSLKINAQANVQSRVREYEAQLRAKSFAEYSLDWQAQLSKEYRGLTKTFFYTGWRRPLKKPKLTMPFCSGNEALTLWWRKIAMLSSSTRRKLLILSNIKRYGSTV